MEDEAKEMQRCLRRKKKKRKKKRKKKGHSLRMFHIPLVPPSLLPCASDCATSPQPSSALFLPYPTLLYSGLCGWDRRGGSFTSLSFLNPLPAHYIPPTYLLPPLHHLQVYTTHAHTHLNIWYTHPHIPYT